jgi:hypothetical protein
MQHKQIFELKITGPGGQRLWAYRYRLGGRGSPRIQRGGYASADDAREALQQALTATQRRKGRVRLTLADLAEEYAAQHDAEPETTAKLAWLLTKATATFGSTPLTELDARGLDRVRPRASSRSNGRCRASPARSGDQVSGRDRGPGVAHRRRLFLARGGGRPDALVGGFPLRGRRFGGVRS